MAGVNREMSPWMRMTYPPEIASLDLGAVGNRLGETLFVSWVLALGFLPFERWQLAISAIGPGRRFVERSRVLSLEIWQHERSVEPCGEGAKLTDTLTFEPRVAALAPVVEKIVGAFFAHRHRKLQSFFGSP